MAPVGADDAHEVVLALPTSDWSAIGSRYSVAPATWTSNGIEATPEAHEREAAVLLEAGHLDEIGFAVRVDAFGIRLECPAVRATVVENRGVPGLAYTVVEKSPAGNEEQAGAGPRQSPGPVAAGMATRWRA